jgi:hypothetical protein
MTTVAPTPTDRLKNTLEEMRASLAATKGLAGALAAAILSLLDVLVALVADFRAGALPVPPGRTAPHAGGTCAEAAAREAVVACEAVAAREPAAIRSVPSGRGRHGQPSLPRAASPADRSADRGGDGAGAARALPDARGAAAVGVAAARESGPVQQRRDATATASARPWNWTRVRHPPVRLHPIVPKIPASRASVFKNRVLHGLVSRDQIVPS